MMTHAGWPSFQSFLAAIAPATRGCWRDRAGCQKLKFDKKAPEIEEHIATTMRLAEALGFTGTPSFVVGDQLIPGFVEKAQLAEVVSAARAIK